jgi:hypothetical protein
LLVATALSVFMLSAATVQAQGRSGACEESNLAVLASPVAPWKGASLRVVFTSEKPLDGELSLVAPDGSVAAKSRKRFGGPPYFWFAEVVAPAAGKWRANLASSDCGNVGREIAVRADQPQRPQTAAGSVWPVRNAWDRGMESLFSAWVEKLFDAPLDAAPSWPALHEVLRDKSRNVLFNHLGLGEDEMKIVLRPDCADLPYFLRSYFAFKMGLPFGYSKCSRGGGGNPPACFGWASIQNAEAGKGGNLAASFGNYMRVVADGVHSGSGRTRASDDNTDYYPVSLEQDTLRPGTIYADPYGHILMLVKRVPQTSDGAGVFLAVDGQPDGTVARKRFWRGNFLYAQDPALGSPGFKRFRPVVLDRSHTLRRRAMPRSRRTRNTAIFARPVASQGPGLLRSYGRRHVSGAARSAARDDGSNHLARRAGETRVTSVERPQVSEQRQGRRVDAGRTGDFRDDWRLGRFRDAIARSAIADRDGRGVPFSGPRCTAARTLCDADRQESVGRQGRA